MTLATFGYETGLMAPGVKDPGKGAYRAAHVIIRAHAETWHLYNDNYRQSQNGKSEAGLGARTTTMVRRTPKPWQLQL